MISFDDMDRRLADIGKNRAWLAEVTGRSADSIRGSLAPNALPHKRSSLLQKALSDAIEKEEAAQASGRESNTDDIVPDRITLEVHPDKFDAYNRAASEVKGRTVKQWAIEELDKAAEAWLVAQSYRADSRANVVGISEFEQDSAQILAYTAPLLRAAAGSPILSDAEMIEVDRDLGPGRFILELRGDSMEPRFRDRQRVVMRDKSTLKRPMLKYGELYCFIHEGQACFKQWAKDSAGNKVLRSLNPDHADIPATEETDWIGWFDLNDQ